jgi:ABC-2 type transport system permease protein
MTTTATAPAQVSAKGGRGTLAGTRALVRFNLRRDRIKLPAWLFGFFIFTLYYGAALPQVYKTQEDLSAVTQFVGGAVGAIIAGPGFGLDDPTIESVIVGVYGLYFLLLAALMNILLVSRHTRVEEQTGRAELVRSSVVGRHAHLSAALIVAVVANVLLSFVIAGAIGAAGLDTSDALLFGAGVGAVGLVWSGITAATAQVSTFSRAGSGIAGAILGAAYVIRAAGDTITEGGSALSWLSPIAWSQQTRAYVDGRWWPLLLSVALAGGAAALGYALSSRRDVGAGLVPPRAGNPEAPAWLNSSLSSAFRMHRASLIGWGIALVAAAAIYGGLTRPIVDAYEDFPENVIDVLGGDTDRLLDGYISTMALTFALTVAVYAILGLQTARGEETKGRAEPILATAVSRNRWLGGHATVVALGSVVLLAISGLVLGIATAASVGDSAYVWDTTAAHLVYAPALLVLLGVSTLLFGFAPRAIGATWAVLGFGLIIGFFGPLMDLPSWVARLSPFERTSRLPLDDLAWTPLLVLTAIAAALIAAGLYGFRQRDLETK